MTIRPFAKLFETEDLGQLLVFTDQSDEGKPCIRTMFYSPVFEMMATVTSSFPDTEEGEAGRDGVFAELTVEKVRNVVLDLASLHGEPR